MAILHGMDISQFQGNIDWDAVKKSKECDFAIIRGGFATTKDTMAERNLAECNRVGIPCGIYWFSYALNEEQAKAEANACLALAKKYKIEYPIVYDLEEDSIRYMKNNGINPTANLVSAIINTFFKEIQKAGYYGLWYTNHNLKDGYLTGGVPLNNINANIWLAAWYIPKPDINCMMWQYTEKGSMPGIIHNVDRDYSYYDFPSMLRSKGYNNLKPYPWASQASDWALESVTWAIENGILKGKGNNNYGLQGNITVEQMCVMLERYHNKFGN